jgi:ATP-dependent Clp protease ATP-binding subunit ClpA
VLSKELEVTLNLAFKEAREQRHEFMTVEHLLLALLDNPTAAKVLRACGADLAKLRAQLQQFITENSPLLGESDERDTQPTLGFQRVLQRAVFQVQSSGKKEVSGDLWRTRIPSSFLSASAECRPPRRRELPVARNLENIRG